MVDVPYLFALASEAGDVDEAEKPWPSVLEVLLWSAVV